jgi:predicted small metal-binding protein
MGHKVPVHRNPRQVLGRHCATAGAYDVAMKQIDCVCGYVIKAEDDEELWQKAQDHMRSDHPDLVGKLTREDILAQAEET